MNGLSIMKKTGRLIIHQEDTDKGPGSIKSNTDNDGMPDLNKYALISEGQWIYEYVIYF